MSDAKRRAVAIPPHAWFRFFFFASHLVVPLTAVVVIIANVFCEVTLSWELISLVAVALLPFLLPLLGVYVWKIGGVELNEVATSGVVPSTVDQAPPPPPLNPPVPPPAAHVAPVPNPAPIPTFASWEALTSEEKKMMRTLWRFQSEYFRNGQPGLWGFTIGEGSPDYRGFVRGFSSLAQRGLVLQDPRALVFLTKMGIEFCRMNSDIIEKDGDAWTQFAPAPAN